MSTLQQVPTGLYFGFTYGELQSELARYKQEVTKSGTRLAGASVNGQSYQFAGREGTLAEWSAELQAALSYLRPDEYLAAPTNSAAVRFC
jgi:hypothetical protein